jgi:hypothetical protein
MLMWTPPGEISLLRNLPATDALTLRTLAGRTFAIWPREREEKLWLSYPAQVL